MNFAIFVMAAICLVGAIVAPVVHLPALIAVILTLSGAALLGCGVVRVLG